MRIESKLCHLSENKAVVKVNGWLNDKKVGSSLAEGATVELAEDKAITRLKNRIKIKINDEEITNSKIEYKKVNQVNVEFPESEMSKNNNLTNEPSDWSKELTAIDLEIARLNWTRDDEIKFLEETFGYNNRSKITNYKELVKYLDILKKTDISNTYDFNEDKIKTMIEESDIILKELSWDNIQGRDYLQKEFNVSTRKELDVRQLTSFIAKLKSIRNKYLSN